MQPSSINQAAFPDCPADTLTQTQSCSPESILVSVPDSGPVCTHPPLQCPLLPRYHPHITLPSVTFLLTQFQDSSLSPQTHMWSVIWLGARNETKRCQRGWMQAYPEGPDWHMRKSKGGEEPGPPKVPASPCRLAGSLPLAGRRLGGKKTRRRAGARGGRRD